MLLNYSYYLDSCSSWENARIKIKKSLFIFTHFIVCISLYVEPYFTPFLQGVLNNTYPYLQKVEWEKFEGVSDIMYIQLLNVSLQRKYILTKTLPEFRIYYCKLRSIKSPLNCNRLLNPQLLLFTILIQFENYNLY